MSSPYQTSTRTRAHESCLSWLAYFGLSMFVLLLPISTAEADDTEGAWGPVLAWPHIPVSAANLPDGRVLTWSGSERDTWPTTEQTYSATWDPATGEFVEIFHDNHNMFCAHLSLTEDGQVFVNGGRNQLNSPWTSMFDYRDNQWTQIENMATGGRWYPVTLTLPSGEIMTNMGTATNFRNPEKWSADQGWEVLNGVDYNDMRSTLGGTDGGRRWWANLAVTPEGDVFHFWDATASYLIQTSGVGDYRNANVTTDGGDHAPGVLVQFAEGKLLVAGGNQGTWRTGSRTEAFVIDLNGATPSITATGSMAFARTFANLVTLPTGEVLAIGGNTSGQTFSDNGTVFEAEIWNPTTGEWRVVATMDIPRNYHSTALLLTDGTVLAAGGGYGASNPIPANHQDGQVFTPPYLFAADGSLAVRPDITSSDGILTLGDELSVTATANLDRFTMVRLGSTTHAVNTDSRFHEVPFVEDSAGQYTLSPTSNPNLLIPGYWMLFAIDTDGIPSEAQVIRVEREVPVEPWQFVKLTAVSEVNGGDTAAIAEISVFNGDGLLIQPSGMTASADSEAAGALAPLAIDGNASTFWQTNAADGAHPHEFIIDLGVGHQISGISYLPRADSEEGRILDYEIRLSFDGINWTGALATGTFENAPTASPSRLHHEVIQNVGSNWITVTLPSTYTDMVVVASVIYDSNDLPAVTRVRNAVGDSFELRVQNPGNATLGGYSVSYIAVEAGQYTVAADGVKFEAVKTLSTITDENNSWVGQAQSYANSYASPVVIGQVMTENDADWSVFWSSDGNRQNPPSASSIFVGKHVAEDPSNSRADETIGYLVFEAGTTAVDNLAIESGVTSDTIEGISHSDAPYSYSVASTDGTVVAASAAMDGSDGGWVVLDTNPLSAGNLSVAIDEDRLNDNDGFHTTEQVAYVIVSDALTPQDVFFDTSFPLSEVEITPTPASATGVSVAFSATSGLNLEYQWSFGDGTLLPFGTDSNANHTYAATGRFNVVLTVRDVLTNEEASISSTQIVYDAAIDPNDDGLRRLSSTSVVFHPTRDEIWNVNPDNATTTVIAASTLTKLAEIAVGQNPRSLAVAPDGRVWVVAKGDSSIHVIDPATGTVDATIELAVGVEDRSPHGIVFSPLGSVVFVAMEDSGQIAEIDATTLEVLRYADVGLHARHIAIAQDGLILYVSRFITPPVPGEDSLLPAPEQGGGEVLAIDTGNLTILNTILINYSDDLETENTGPGLPNYLGPLAMSPDPNVAYVPSKQDKILGGSQRLGSDLDFDHTVRSISSRIDLTTGIESTLERIDYDNASIASHAAFGPYGVHLFSSLEGNRQVAISDTLTDSEIIRFDVGRAPQGLAVSPDGKRLAVHNFMDRSVQVIDVTNVVDLGGDTVTSLGTVGTVDSEDLPPQVLLGKQHFYDARDDRLASLDYMSCASCHNEAGSDGRIWDFGQFGEGLRTTIALKGHGDGHGPLHWTANFDEVQDFEGQIRGFAQGLGLMSDEDFEFGTRSDPLGDPKAGLSTDLDALAAYIASLNTVGNSPLREGNGNLSADGVLGRTLFENQNCAACHSGAAFTDSATEALHDVGTLDTHSGPQVALDTPTLLGLWATGPYLHDGSAPTIKDAIIAHTALNLPLTDGELTQLAAYVAQIDDLEASAWTPPDTDGDGYHDGIDAFPNDPTEWFDSDSDGVGDNADAFPMDPNETEDTDGDGVGDNGDVFPNDPTESSDLDGDGVGDNADVFPNDPTEAFDSDSDGVGDNADAFPNDPTETADSDGDGVGDNGDAFPNDPNETVDTDGDGFGDNGDVFPNDPTEWSDRDGDGLGDNSDPYPDDPTNTPPSVGRLHHEVIQNVGSNWITVTLPSTYTDMVVVASVIYDGNDLPAVTRVRNAVGNSFELRVQNPSNATLGGYAVSYIAVEAGQYTEAADGVKFEAVKTLSTITDENNSWVGQAQSYANSYASPVVIGQVMTENDSAWSVFWSSNGNRATPPSASSIFVGKNVAEDPSSSRANETIGYLVFEAGTTTVGDFFIEAGVTSDSVRDLLKSAAPYSYSVASTEGTVVAALTAMDGNNGGWAVLGIDPLSAGTLSVAIDEDQLNDNERNHTTEQVAYVIVGGGG